MTRKHFEQIARVIAGCQMPPDHRGQLAADLARYFKTQNSRFDRERFAKACGVEL